MTTLGQWLQAEPFTLAMSSGFFGFFAHAGMLAALDEAGLRPARVAGSSAGALVAGCWASGLGPADIREALFGLKRTDFWDPAPGAGLLRGARFEALLGETLKASTFDACRVPLAVSAYGLGGRGTVVFDSGELAPAVRASCGFPVLFQPIRIDGVRYIDGGVADRPGLAGVPLGTRTLHHHLSSRSPWRRPSSPALAPPRRDGLVALVIDDIPRVSPFRLAAGPSAWRAGYEGTSRALDTEVDDGVVRTTV